MKSLVILSFCICLAHGDSSTSQEVKQKTLTKTINAIPIIQKSQLYYQPVQYQPAQHQHQIQSQQLIPVQIIPKPYYVPHQQPTMIIIAQPALLPSNVVYGAATQQLLNYFHSNPQAKYQLLHGNYQPHAQTQHQVIQQVSPAQTIGSYQFLPAPSHYQALPTQHQYQQVNPVHFQSAPQAVHYQAAPAQLQSNHILNQLPNHYSTYTAPASTSSASASSASASQSASSSHKQHQPVQLTQLAQLAQLAAQHYASSPYKQTPPIVTGFENFTPEQQAQIKQQLNNHLGSTINVGATSGTGNQYSSKYVSTQSSATASGANSDEFVPSQQLKSNDDAAVSNSQEISKTQYTKG